MGGFCLDRLSSPWPGVTRCRSLIPTHAYLGVQDGGLDAKKRFLRGVKRG